MFETRKNNIPIVAIFGERLTKAFAELDIAMGRAQIEQFAHFLAHSMGSETRDFHHPEHSLDVANNLTGVFALAALFHNVVYTQVDSTWERWMGDMIPDIVISRKLTVNVIETLQRSQDHDVHLCAYLFGFEGEMNAGPEIGLNEFLSAVVFFKKMKPLIPLKTLLMGVSGIASMIPYRRVKESDAPAAKRVGDRLKTTAKKIKVEFNEIDISEALTECQKMVRADLSYFVEPKASYFLSGMWRIMYEKNPSLRNSYFSIAAFRRCVQATYDSMMTLDGKDMLWVNTEVPGDARLGERANHNLTVGRYYLNAQLVSIALLEAVALSTGGDCAWELFYGSKKRSREDTPISLDDMLLPSDVSLDKTPVATEVYSLLKDGRQLRSRFDRKTNALAAYLYGSLRSKEFGIILEYSQQFFKRQIKADEFLTLFSKRVVETVLISLTRTATTRVEAIEDLRKSVVKRAA